MNVDGHSPFGGDIWNTRPILFDSFIVNDDDTQNGLGYAFRKIDTYEVVLRE